MKAVSPKYRTLCDTAFKLFTAQGFKKIRVETICREAGVSKMTFYKYFKNKDDILVSVLKEWMNKKMNETRQLLSGTDMLEERLRLFVRWKGEWIKDFSQEFLMELYTDDSPVKDMLLGMAGESMTILEDYFTRAKKSGQLNPDVSVTTLMIWMNSMSNLLMDDSLKGQFESTEEMYRQVTSLYFYGILGKGNK